MNLQPLASTALSLTCGLMLVACGGSSAPSDVYNASDENFACPDVYQPVCGLAGDNGQYRYQTFSNRCFAKLGDAYVSFESACGALEDEVTEVSQPLIVQGGIEQLPESSTSITVLDSEIIQDVAQLTLEHSGGCDVHHFGLNVAPPFMESWPLQIHGRLTHETEDTCEAVVISQVSIDLLPLKNLYRMSYKSESGEIMIPYVGLYQF
ncbi:hypothetical protein [Marinimicrobium sp. ABcell2]|uniref:hypothetical protein n=1 Tax=Marinimicrobium sp. ABcell2 TaxID=3069751 RepID=UPI0027B2AE19|nr:hypothetical protein [Marinimicrobium sp. ABcell2]MDQ2076400.1 hypothetical protein [Marinimicrobium sp. ABcell2]